mmetsp:Transcript_22629/g.70837  ORF Transcript_22629/g.70837 Transcript_22629/m.70837 type:complete len:790 (-) Transcript_22629:118-2487(-)
MNERDLVVELALEADEGHHDLDVDRVALGDDLRRRLEDGAGLHLGDFGIRDGEPNTAMAEHRVDLVQLVDAVRDVVEGHAELLGERELGRRLVRQELAGGGVQEPNGDRQSVDRLEHAVEVVALLRHELVGGAAAGGVVVGEDHLAHVVDAVPLEEHVLAAAEADPFGAEFHRELGLPRGVDVGSDLELAVLVGPGHDRLEDLVRVARLWLELALEDLVDLGGRGRDAAGVDVPARAVDRDEVALAERGAADAEHAARVVDGDVVRAADADLAHLPGDERGVRGDAAARREDALGGDHAAQVLGRRLDPTEHGLLALALQRLGAEGRESDVARRGARACGQAGREGGRVADGVAREGRGQQAGDGVGRDAAEGGLLVDEARVDHLVGDADRGEAGALAVARLEDVELFLLDRELDVLHVGELGLEDAADLLEVGVRVGHLDLHLLDRFGRADAGDDVLALGVDQVLAPEHVLAVRRGAREADAGRRGLAEVPKDHGLDVDRRAPLRRNAVPLPVELGPVVLPRAEDGADRAPQLLVRVLRELGAGPLDDERLEALDQLAQVVARQLEVVLLVALRLELLHDGVERLVIVLVPGLHAQHDVAVHGDEAPVAVEREPLVPRPPGEADHRLVVQPEVQHGVHHAWHRVARPGAHAHQERVVGVAEPLPYRSLHARDARAHFRVHRRRIRPVVRVVVGAHLGRDGEPGRHGEADLRHRRQIRALPAEQRPLRAVPVRLLRPEVEHVFLVMILVVHREHGGFDHFFFPCWDNRRAEPPTRRPRPPRSEGCCRRR